MISRAYALGLVFIVLVAFIWAGSSVLTQYLYTNDSFDSPFLLTYIGVSLFTLWLPTHFVMEWMGQLLGWPNNKSVAIIQSENGGHVELGERGVYQSLPSSENVIDGVDGDGDVDADCGNDDDDDDEQPRDEVQSPSDQPQHTEAANNNSNNNYCENTTTWTHADHRHAAMRIAPVWFIANWTYNASLAYTSITSSTVLASTGSLFTFLFATCTRDERFTLFKLYGVLLGVLGSCLTAWHDGSASNDNSNNNNHQQDGFAVVAAFAEGATEDEKTTGTAALWGDVLGLMSAIGYGGYAVQTRLLCPHDESRYSMQILLGYIGLFNMMALSPIALYTLLHNNNQNNNNGLTWIVFGFLVFKGLLDNVLSDYLWLRAVMLTSATVATVGLGLTIPLALLSDVFYFQKQNIWNAGSVGGALAVLTGFVLVNIGNDEDEQRNEEEQAQTWEGDMETAGDDDDEQPRPAFQGYQDEVEE